MCQFNTVLSDIIYFLLALSIGRWPCILPCSAM